MPIKTYGRLTITRNGSSVKTRGDVEVTPGLDEVETSRGVDGHSHERRSPQSAKVSCSASFDPETYNDITSRDPCSIVVEFEGGGTWVGEGAKFVGDGKVNGDTGAVTFEWAMDQLSLI